ncbi:MAG TPA: DUF58 domain-containing protein [Desulfomonilaceae bacterium]|nr:DUF58 domain-containing protein [Desulfomonilaceae bacterium]
MNPPNEPHELQLLEMRAAPFFFSRRFFLWFGSASLALVVLYIYSPSSLYVPLTVDGLLIVAALVDYAAAPGSDTIRVTRPMPYPLTVDRPNTIGLEITNVSGRPLSLIIHDDIPDRCVAEHLPARVIAQAGSGTRTTYRLTPVDRGIGEFGNIHFWFPGPMGLVWKRGQSRAAATVKLYPGLSLLERNKMKVWRESSDHLVRALRQKGQGTEFDSLRDYAVGDDPRLIHWAATARKAKLIVRQNRIERSQTIFLVLDAGRMMTARVLGKTKFDYGLNAALLLAYSALHLGDNVGIMVVGQDVMCFLPPNKGPGQFGRILDATYSLEPKMEEPRFYRALSDISVMLRRRSLVVIFTDLIDERASEGLKRYSLGLLPRHLPLVVAMTDTEVVNIAEKEPDNTQELYQQAVASEVLERRERLLARFSSAGVLVLDSEPDRISASVLGRYLEIKARSLL